METADFFRARIDAMLNLSDPLAVLATRLPWDQIEASVAAKFERQHRAGQILEGQDQSAQASQRGGAIDHPQQNQQARVGTDPRSGPPDQGHDRQCPRGCPAYSGCCAAVARFAALVCADTLHRRQILPFVPSTPIPAAAATG